MKAELRLYFFTVLLLAFLGSEAAAQTVEEAAKVLPGKWKSDTVSTFLGSIAYDYVFNRDGTGNEETFHMVMGEPETTTKNFRWVAISNEKIKLTFSDGVVVEKALNIVDNDNVVIESDTFRRIAHPAVRTAPKAKPATSKSKAGKKTKKKAYGKKAHTSDAETEPATDTYNTLRKEILQAALHPLDISQPVSDVSPTRFETLIYDKGVKFTKFNSGSTVSFSMNKESATGIPVTLYLKGVCFYKNFTAVTYTTAINGPTSNDSLQNKLKYAADITETLGKAGFRGQKISEDGREYSKFRINARDYAVVSINETAYSCSVDLDFYIH